MNHRIKTTDMIMIEVIRLSLPPTKELDVSYEKTAPQDFLISGHWLALNKNSLRNLKSSMHDSLVSGLVLHQNQFL